ncbi:MAG: hypothetical protein DHS20C18_11540 [Saprospiraceae bacterium]|nr:MAG: hypothetical protein DHS20C18_11540 [Saprospiraceae bacterium]
MISILTMFALTNKFIMIDEPLTTSEISGFILERTAKRMKQFFQQQLSAADADVTIDQWIVLQSLQEEDGLSQLAIANATFKDAPTVTRIIDLLCKKKLTRREPDTNDRRRFNIRLTTAGHQKIAAVMPVIRQARKQAWGGLNETEIDQLVSTLNQVFENINMQS